MKDNGSNKFVRFITQSFGAVSKYLLGKVIAMVIIIVVSGFALRYADAKLANDSIKGEFLLGILMGAGNMIPVLGVWVGIALSAILVMAQTIPDYWFMFLVVIGIGLALQAVDEFIITPLVVGKAVDLKPLIIIAVVYLGGAIFGVVGMIFAVPVAAVLKIAYEIFIKKKTEKAEDKTGSEDGGEV